MGDTRLVAVISTRIGCGVSDATTRVGSRVTGDSAMFCTWPPMLSIAMSSGVLAAVVQMDDERVMPHFETTQAVGFWPEWAHHRWTAGVLQRRPYADH